MAGRSSSKKPSSAKALAELGRYKALLQMAGGFVHQLRTPLHIIQSSAEDLAGQNRFLPTFKPQAALIARSAHRMEATVNAFLNFLKGDPLKLQPGSVNELIERLGDFLKDECGKPSVKLQKQLNSRKSILLDSYHLQEAFLNLLTNALQAMPRGGVLSIQTEDSGKNEVVVRIRDTGVGMDKKTLAKLETPFQTTKKEGLGLGVFFTREILKRHRGKIEFFSQKGQGTTVTLIFPAA
jgi:signal transduction histidine kinase